MEGDDDIQEKQQENENGNDEDVQLEKQKLKSALHFFVGEIATNHASSLDFGTGPLTIDKHAIAALTEITFDFAENLAVDLESFAHHAKRTTVSMEDNNKSRLAARRTKELQTRITEEMKRLSSASDERKAEKKRKKTITSVTKDASGKEEEEDENIQKPKGKKFFGGKS